MRFIQRMAILLICISLLIGLPACGDAQPDASDEDQEQSEQVTTYEAGTTVTTTVTETLIEEEDPLGPYPQQHTISWLTTKNDDVYYNDGFDQKMLEEHYNIKLNVWNISNQDAIGLDMMLAAGEFPDVAYIPKAPMNAAELYEEGFTRSISLAKIQSRFPYYYAQMRRNEPLSFRYNQIIDENGSATDYYYGLGVLTSEYATYRYIPFMRLDWLQNIGYDITHGSLTPITLTDDLYGPFSDQLYITNQLFSPEEMLDIIRKFSEDDPNQSGQNDTYGGLIFPHSFRHEIVDTYWGQFGLIASDDRYLYRDTATGEVVPWYAYSGYKKYLSWANDMRQRGWLRAFTPNGEQEMTPDDYKRYLAQLQSGQYGFFTADRTFVLNPDQTEKSALYPPQSLWLNEDHAFATFVTFPTLAGTGPESAWGTKRSKIHAFADAELHTYTFAADVSDEKLERIFIMWNERYTNQDSNFWQLVLYGIEDVHYRFTGEPWRSGMLITPDDEIPAPYRHYGGFGGHFVVAPSFVENEAMSIYMRHFRNNQWARRFTLSPYKYIDRKTMGDSLYDGYMQAYSIVEEALHTTTKTLTTSIWQGQQTDIESVWQEYLPMIYAAGLRELIDEYFDHVSFASFRQPDLG